MDQQLLIEHLIKLRKRLLRKKKSELIDILNQYIEDNGNLVSKVPYNISATKEDITNAIISYY